MNPGNIYLFCSSTMLNKNVGWIWTFSKLGHVEIFQDINKDQNLLNLKSFFFIYVFFFMLLKILFSISKAFVSYHRNIHNSLNRRAFCVKSELHRSLLELHGCSMPSRMVIYFNTLTANYEVTRRLHSFQGSQLCYLVRCLLATFVQLRLNS